MRELPAPGLIPDDQPVQVQQVVHWESEYRCFVLHGQVLTISIYSRDHALARSSEGDTLRARLLERIDALRAAFAAQGRSFVIVTSATSAASSTSGGTR